MTIRRHIRRDELLQSSHEQVGQFLGLFAGKAVRIAVHVDVQVARVCSDRSRQPCVGSHGDRSLPLIPGSTLRGLVRNTLRMLTGGESGPVNTPMLFFRAPVRVDSGGADGSPSTRARQVMARRHDHYRRRRAGHRTRQGFLYRDPDDGGWYAVEVPATALEPEPGRALKVTFDVLRESLRTWDFGVAEFPDPPRDGTYVPTAHEQHGRLQHRWVYAVHLRGRRGIAAVAPDEPGARAHLAAHGGSGGVIPALLVLTGSAAQERRNAYLFPRPRDPRAGRLPVPESLVELFESAAQVTGYQRAAFPDTLGTTGDRPDRPPVAGAGGGGLPRRGLEPVWFDLDPSGRVVSFGRSGGYRVAGWVTSFDAGPPDEDLVQSVSG